jgi:N-acetylneuraminate lyase
VDGVYVCGSTGEGMVLPTCVRKKIVEVAVRNSPPRKQVIVHVGAWSFNETSELARHASVTGVTAISSLPPAGASFSELLEHYRSLAAMTSLPFLAYYFPAAGSGTLSLNQLEDICALPRVAGLKFTDYDLYTLSLLIRAGSTVFNGRDEVLCAGLLMGASGGIGSIYNIKPASFVKLYRHAREGRWQEAREEQDRINAVIRVLLRFPFMPALKQWITWEGIDCGQALPPRQPLTAGQREELKLAVASLA